MKIIAIVHTLRDDPTETVQSIINQSVQVAKILVVVGSKSLYDKLACANTGSVEYFYLKPNFSQPLGKRVGAAINFAFSKQVLQEYDYILKVDAEVILPADFIKINLTNMPDFIGTGGSAMLFKTYAFLKAVGGKYPEVFADDTYLGSKFLYEGFTYKRWLCDPQFKSRRKGHHSYKHELERGVEWYKLGYEPIHVLDYLRQFTFQLPKRVLNVDLIFPVIGYFWGAFKNVDRYEIASWIFVMQVRRLLYGRQFEY